MKVSLRLLVLLVLACNVISCKERKIITEEEQNRLLNTVISHYIEEEPTLFSYKDTLILTNPDNQLDFETFIPESDKEFIYKRVPREIYWKNWRKYYWFGIFGVNIQDSSISLIIYHGTYSEIWVDSMVYDRITMQIDSTFSLGAINE